MGIPTYLPKFPQTDLKRLALDVCGKGLHRGKVSEGERSNNGIKRKSVLERQRCIEGIESNFS